MNHDSIMPLKILYFEIGKSPVAEIQMWILPVLCYARAENAVVSRA